MEQHSCKGIHQPQSRRLLMFLPTRNTLFFIRTTYFLDEVRKFVNKWKVLLVIAKDRLKQFRDASRWDL